MKLYVGNLPWSIGNQELEDLFSSYGTVTSANVITDRDTKRSRGFGFVELDSGGAEAIEAMNESEVEGRKVIVNEARPKTQLSGCFRELALYTATYFRAGMCRCRLSSLQKVKPKLFLNYCSNNQYRN